MKGNSEQARLINSQLDILKSKVLEVENGMIYNNIEINAQSFKNKFLGVEEKTRKLIAIFEDHNIRMRQLVGTCHVSQFCSLALLFFAKPQKLKYHSV